MYLVLKQNKKQKKAHRPVYEKEGVHTHIPHISGTGPAVRGCGERQHRGFQKKIREKTKDTSEKKTFAYIRI